MSREEDKSKNLKKPFPLNEIDAKNLATRITRVDSQALSQGLQNFNAELKFLDGSIKRLSTEIEAIEEKTPTLKSLEPFTPSWGDGGVIDELLETYETVYDCWCLEMINAQQRMHLGNYTQSTNLQMQNLCNKVASAIDFQINQSPANIDFLNKLQAVGKKILKYQTKLKTYHVSFDTTPLNNAINAAQQFKQSTGKRWLPSVSFSLPLPDEKQPLLTPASHTNTISSSFSSVASSSSSATSYSSITMRHRLTGNQAQPPQTAPSTQSTDPKNNTTNSISKS